MKIVEEPIEQEPEPIVVEPVVVEEAKEPEISRVIGAFRRIFLKQKKPLPATNIPLESAKLDEAFFEDLPPKDLKPGLIAKILAPFKALFYEKKLIKETGLSTRQRIKRYDAMMAGDHGVKKQGKKSAAK